MTGEGLICLLIWPSQTIIRLHVLETPPKKQGISGVMIVVPDESSVRRLALVRLSRTVWLLGPPILRWSRMVLREKERKQNRQGRELILTETMTVARTRGKETSGQGGLTDRGLNSVVKPVLCCTWP